MTPTEWIYNHNDIKISFNKYTSMSILLPTECLEITMSIKYSGIICDKPYIRTSQKVYRNFNYMPTDDELVNTFEEMYEICLKPIHDAKKVIESFRAPKSE